MYCIVCNFGSLPLVSPLVTRALVGRGIFLCPAAAIVNLVSRPLSGSLYSLQISSGLISLHVATALALLLLCYTHHLGDVR